MDELRLALQDFRGAILKPLADFLYGPFFRSFMAVGWVACVALVVFGIHAGRWDLIIVAIAMANGYAYFAWHGPPKR